jgi:hypothetical protein
VFRWKGEMDERTLLDNVELALKKPHEFKIIPSGLFLFLMFLFIIFSVKIVFGKVEMDDDQSKINQFISH